MTAFLVFDYSFESRISSMYVNIGESVCISLPPPQKHNPKKEVGSSSFFH